MVSMIAIFSANNHNCRVTRTDRDYINIFKINDVISNEQMYLDYYYYILDLYRSATNRLRATEETKAWLTSVNYWFISPRVHEVDIPVISVSAARKARDLTVEFNSARWIDFRGKTVRGTKFRGLLACFSIRMYGILLLCIKCTLNTSQPPFSLANARLISSSLIFTLACNVLRR